jgi:hypothetical protein
VTFTKEIFIVCSFGSHLANITNTLTGRQPSDSCGTAGADSGLPNHEGHGRHMSVESNSDAESAPSTPSCQEGEPGILPKSDAAVPRRLYDPANDSNVNPDKLSVIMAAVDLSKKDSIQQHFPLPDNRTYKSLHPKPPNHVIAQESPFKLPLPEGTLPTHKYMAMSHMTPNTVYTTTIS